MPVPASWRHINPGALLCFLLLFQLINLLSKISGGKYGVGDHALAEDVAVYGAVAREIDALIELLVMSTKPSGT